MREKTTLAGYFLLWIFLFQPGDISAQSNAGVTSLLTENAFSSAKLPKPYHPVPFSLRKGGFFARINPVTICSAGLLFFYQAILSEQIQADCNFEISCSNYTKRSIERFGLMKGVLLGFDQVTNCSAVQVYDYPRYKISPRAKIINEFESK